MLSHCAVHFIWCVPVFTCLKPHKCLHEAGLLRVANFWAFGENIYGTMHHKEPQKMRDPLLRNSTWFRCQSNRNRDVLCESVA